MSPLDLKRRVCVINLVSHVPPPPLQSVKLPISDSDAYLGSHDFCKPLEGANVPPVVRGPHLDDPEPSRGKTRSATLRRGRHAYSCGCAEMAEGDKQKANVNSITRQLFP